MEHDRQLFLIIGFWVLIRVSRWRARLLPCLAHTQGTDWFISFLTTPGAEQEAWLVFSLVKWSLCGSDRAGDCPKVTQVSGRGRIEIRLGSLECSCPGPLCRPVLLYPFGGTRGFTCVCHGMTGCSLSIHLLSLPLPAHSDHRTYQPCFSTSTPC